MLVHSHSLSSLVDIAHIGNKVNIFLDYLPFACSLLSLNHLSFIRHVICRHNKKSHYNLRKKYNLHTCQIGKIIIHYVLIIQSISLGSFFSFSLLHTGKTQSRSYNITEDLAWRYYKICVCIILTESESDELNRN